MCCGKGIYTHMGTLAGAHPPARTRVHVTRDTSTRAGVHAWFGLVEAMRSCVAWYPLRGYTQHGSTGTRLRERQPAKSLQIRGFASVLPIAAATGQRHGYGGSLMGITKADLEAQNALLAKALGEATSGESEPTGKGEAKPRKTGKVRQLAGLHAIPDSKFGMVPEPRESGNHVVSVITLGKDGAPIMSAKTGAPRKPVRIPVQVAEYLLTDDGQDALREQVDSLD